MCKVSRSPQASFCRIQAPENLFARGLQRHQRLRVALAHEHRRLRVRAEVPEAAGPQVRGA